MDTQSHISCPNCGAQVDLAPGKMAVTCPYCGSEISLVKPQSKEVAPMGFLVPTEADGQAMRKIVNQVLAENPAAPDDILDSGRFEEEAFVFYPAWRGQGTFDCRWTASFGYDRWEEYVVYETRTNDRGRSYQVPVRRQRQVTDWRPASGTAAGSFSALLFAGDKSGLPDIVPEALENRCPMDRAVAWNSALTGGLRAEDPVLPMDAAQREITAMVQKGRAMDAAMEHAQGDRQRDWTVNATVAFSSPLQLGLIPLAKAVYLYQGKKYGFWLEGAALSLLYSDPPPKDQRRPARIRRGYLPFFLGLVLGAAGLYASVSTGLPLGGKAMAAGLALLAALIAGKIRSGSISGFSRAVRQASLNKRHLEELDKSGTASDAERRKLFDASRPPAKPFLAETKTDAPFALILAAIVLALTLNAFWEPAKLLVDQWQTGSRPALSASAEGGYQSPYEGGASLQGPAGSYSQGLIESEESPAYQGIGPVPDYSSPEMGERSGSSYADSDQAGAAIGDLPLFDSQSLSCARNYCLDQKGRPASGLVYDLRESSKTLASLGRWRAGQPDGVTVQFDEQMRAERAVTYQKGEPDGLMAVLYPGASTLTVSEVVEIENGLYQGDAYGYDPQGRLTNYGRFESDKPQGRWLEYYADGSVKSLAVFDAGRQSSQAQTFQPGQRRESPPAFKKLTELDSLLKDTRAISQAAKSVR
jgi:DNA-directed RNA polymerase subunit RPC12/RpoP